MAGELCLTLPEKVVAAIAERAAAIAYPLVLKHLDERDGERSPWMTTEEAARYVRCPYESFRKKAAAREVPCRKDGRHLVFHRDELDDWLRGQGRAAA